ncbi:TMM64-like protein [Mya arenaria]|uniref:TMM64-like protein n=1 Tax=Mya arenaria TaxID=6604 RepID=A0ABY7EQB1_MYAAR|nr:TMM64-like protein [Mya arenaria]
MNRIKENLNHLGEDIKEKVTHIHADEAREFLIGGTSRMDQVFLSHQTGGGDGECNIDVCNNELEKSHSEHRTKTAHENHDVHEKKGPNCYQVTLSSIVIISLTCFLLVVCREYIKNLLLWMENLDLISSFVIFTLLYIIVSFPMAWGVILLMIACGYLYGLVYGPIVVEVCSAIGVAVAHVSMKKFCRSFIIRKFYNDSMTAVISVVDGKHGFKVVALTRLTPLTDISLMSYVSASTLGMLPTAILNCYMGTTLRSMNDILTDETNQATGWIVLVIQILFTIALMYFVVRKARVELKKTVEDDDKHLSNKGIPEVIIHREATRMNGFIDRSRKKSGD